MRILLVEDDEDGARVLEKILHRESHSCDRARTVSEAIAAMAHYLYDVALIDINLPDGLGKTLCPLCREKGIKCIAVTGEECAEGFDLMLRKPINFADLKALLNHVK